MSENQRSISLTEFSCSSRPVSSTLHQRRCDSAPRHRYSSGGNVSPVSPLFASSEFIIDIESVTGNPRSESTPLAMVCESGYQTPSLSSRRRSPSPSPRLRRDPSPSTSHSRRSASLSRTSTSRRNHSRRRVRSSPPFRNQSRSPSPPPPEIRPQGFRRYLTVEFFVKTSLAGIAAAFYQFGSVMFYDRYVKPWWAPDA